jgi:hypothetical protein
MPSNSLLIATCPMSQKIFSSKTGELCVIFFKRGKKYRGGGQLAKAATHLANRVTKASQYKGLPSLPAIMCRFACDIWPWCWRVSGERTSNTCCFAGFSHLIADTQLIHGTKRAKTIRKRYPAHGHMDDSLVYELGAINVSKSKLFKSIFDAMLILECLKDRYINSM